ncbi:MAG: MmcQ/YjbR family DNA-binding protein [Granulicella sp.]
MSASVASPHNAQSVIGAPMPANAALFRKLALELPQAVESSHMNHPDFRLNNRIFATLSGEAEGCGMVKLTLEQQAAFLAELPRVFTPVPGGWGRMGMTHVHLSAVDKATLRGALTTAYRNIEAKQAASKQKRTKKSSAPKD